ARGGPVRRGGGRGSVAPVRSAAVPAPRGRPQFGSPPRWRMPPWRGRGRATGPVSRADPARVAWELDQPGYGCASRRLADPDGLEVAELADAVGGQLAAVSGVLDPAEGQRRVRGDHAVDEHRAGLQVVDEPLLLGRVLGPGVGAQPEAGVV